MKGPKFNNGDIVYMDPCGGSRGQIGKIIGVIHNIDGTFGYLISFSDLGAGPVSHVSLNEFEIVLKAEADKNER